MKVRVLWLVLRTPRGKSQHFGSVGVYCSKERAIECVRNSYLFFEHIEDQARIDKFVKKLIENEVACTRRYKYTLWPTPFVDTDWEEEKMEVTDERKSIL